MAKHLVLLFANPIEGREDEYTTWLDDVHFPEVFEVPEFLSAQLFEVSELSPGDNGRRYLAIYEVETDDPAAVMASVRDAAAKWTMSDAFDRTSPVQWWVAPITERKTR